jgi:transposase
MKTDAGKFHAKEQEDKHLLAVKLCAEGLTQQKVANLLEVNRTTVGKWVRRARREGAVALKAQPMGRDTGEGRTLNPDEEKHIQRLICDKRPHHLKMAFAL